MAEGKSPADSLRIATKFLADHFGKLLIFLLLVFLFYIVLLLAILGLIAALIGPITWGVQLLRFLSFFLPAFLSPIVMCMRVKLTYFEDAIVVKPLK